MPLVSHLECNGRIAKWETVAFDWPADSLESPAMRCITALFFAVAALAPFGCEHHEKDSHTEVFKTAQDVVVERRAKQLTAHKELAISVLRFSRPDLEAKSAEGTSISVQADGVTRPIDLLPIEEQLVRHAADERAILRRYLDVQLRPFDFERLKLLSIDRVMKQASFELVNTAGLKEMQQNVGESRLQSVPVVSNIFRVTVIRRGESTVTVPVTAALLEAWKVSHTAVDAAAMENLREGLNNAGENFLESIVFGPAGCSGSLKSGIDPAVILLPEFLTAVQKAWKMQDNLVIFAPAPGGIVMVEQHNQRLLDLLVPQWKKQLATMPSALSEQFLLRDAQGISLFAYAPTTKPATVPATKPAPYFVH